MSVAKAMERARRFCADELGLEGTVIAVVPEEDGWRLTLEAVVEGEYMRQRAQRDLVGIFELLLDGKLTVISFERKETRERGIPFSPS